MKENLLIDKSIISRSDILQRGTQCAEFITFVTLAQRRRSSAQLIFRVQSIHVLPRAAELLSFLKNVRNGNDFYEVKRAFAH